MTIDNAMLYKILGKERLELLIDMIAISDITDPLEVEKVLEYADELMNDYLADEANKLKLLMGLFLHLFFHVDFDSYEFIRKIFNHAKIKTNNLISLMTNIEAIINYFQTLNMGMTIDESKITREVLFLVDAISSFKQVNQIASERNKS